MDDWPSGRHASAWTRNLNALRIWTDLHGNPMAPSSATVTVDGVEVRVGGFVAYSRARHRAGRLDPSRAAQLEALPGWTWDPLPPGPAGKDDRNATVRRLRREGMTLAELSERFGMSRQRISQIAPDRPDPVAHAARLAQRRDRRRLELAAEREAAVRRQVGS